MLDRVMSRAIGALPLRQGLPLLARRAMRRHPDLALARSLCRADKGAIDVGANVGLFSYVFSKHAAWCVAFEPNAELARRLAQALPQLAVHAVGLSDAVGVETLSTPVVAGIPYSGYASMAGSHALSEYPHHTADVAVRTLDSFGLRNVGLIKIDVEGFEEHVLRGAMATIRTERPTLLIEIEERHNPGGLGRINAFLGELGYAPPTAVSGAENNWLFAHSGA